MTAGRADTASPPIRCAGVLLAAGAGRRIGMPKALVELDGRPLVVHAARVLAAGGCDPVVVVTGARGEDVARELRRAAAAGDIPAGTRTVHNPDWRSGMGTSLACGLRAVAGEPIAGAVVHLVDLPGVGADVVDRLVAAQRADRQAFEGGSVEGTRPIAWAATYGDARRNPVLFDRSVLEAVAEGAAGDRGARDWLADHADRVRPVPADDLGSPHDLDTPDELDRWRRRMDVVGSGVPGKETPDAT